MVESLDTENPETTYYEEPESPQQLTLLQSAPSLREITDLSTSQCARPEKAGRLNGLEEPIIVEIEESRAQIGSPCDSTFVSGTWEQIYVRKHTKSTQAARACQKGNSPSHWTSRVSKQRRPLTTCSRSVFYKRSESANVQEVSDTSVTKRLIPF